jgi:outer membrane autotransporter protein
VLKLEGGADVPFSLEGGGRALIGAFAGTGRNALEFDGSTTEAESDAALAGVYAAYRRGGFYGNGIVKYEHHWADLHSEATSDGGAPFELDIWGGSLESGFRFALAQAYVQPRLRLNYAHASPTSFEDASGERIALKSAESLTGEAAARLGLDIGSGKIYVDGGLRREFLGETEAEVSRLTFTDGLPGNLAFIAGGLAFSLFEDRLLLALETGYAKGDEAEEITATGALRMMY